MNVGRRIQELRKQKNMTQEDLAAAMGVTAAAVSKWENGYTLPDILMLCALADFFAVTTDELLGRLRTVKYAVIAAENESLGGKVAELMRRYGVQVRGVYTDEEEAKAAAQADEQVEYLAFCYFSGFHGGTDRTNLVSVADTEEEVLAGIGRVFDAYLKD